VRPKIIAAATLGVVLALPATALERLEPAEGSYFGISLNYGNKIETLSSNLGLTPAVYGRFFNFWTSEQDTESMRSFLEEVTAVQGIAMLTLEPWDGLGAVTQEECRQLAELCREFEERSIGGIFIRFAHEMNGNWYPWGQRPALYKATFRVMAETVRSRTSRTAMLWAPNYGVGYPFGNAVPARGSADFAVLDTNGDGVVSDRDDMYEPYYPGDDVVDWVGMTIYHWGVQFPWLENELPVTNSFVKSLSGRYQGNVPNFYGRYCIHPTRSKPLAITETAAFYNTEMPGPSELRIKQAWWTQVFKAATSLPMLKCINWFDELKREGVAQNNLIDWRISANPVIRDAFMADLRAAGGEHPYFLTTEETKRLAPYYISAKELPEVLPVAGQINVTLEVKAQADCDLVVNLLDDNSQWQGGTQVRITAPGRTVTTSFRLNQPLTDQTGYRWSIFLTPPGETYLSAIVWYRGPNPTDDPDGDGAGNKDEWTAGTSPRDASDVLAIQAQSSAAGIVISWESKVGCRYQLLSTSDLKTWTEASDLTSGTGGRISVSPRHNPTLLHAAYRVRVSRS
jgi:hypothetical protein